MPADAGTLACRSQEPFVKKQAIGRGVLSRFRSSGPRSSSKQNRVSYETANCRKKAQTNSRLICGYRASQTNGITLGLRADCARPLHSPQQNLTPAECTS